MVDHSRRDRVGLGLIGLGPNWEQLYRETLVRLQSRLKIRLVFDPVEARARSVASELNAEVVGSLRQMLVRNSLQGLLVLDPGWCGAGIVNLVAHSGKPAYLSRSVLQHESALRKALTNPPVNGRPNGTSLKADDQLMPELGLRFTPASCRLRELIATKLGAARHIRVNCDLSGEAEEIAQMIDWCTNIIGQEPTRSNRATEESAERGFDFEYPARTGSRSLEKRTAKLRQNSATGPSLRIDVECERGRATLFDRTRIVWETTSEMADESLTEERTEVDILIDQFCRRALGGLNPVGRLSEFVRAVEMVKSTD